MASVAPSREQTPQEADRRVRGVARGNAWPLYCDAMTDPEDKPSFLARLAVVVTVGVIGLQMYNAGWASLTGHWRSIDALSVLVLYPGIFLLGVAGLYYLFKGKPSNADAAIASRLYPVWGVSVIGGAICYAILIYAAKVSVSNQFRF